MALTCLLAPTEGTQDRSWKKEGYRIPRWKVFISNEHPSTAAVYWKRQAPPPACTQMVVPAVSLFPPKWGYSLLDYIESPLCSLLLGPHGPSHPPSDWDSVSFCIWNESLVDAGSLKSPAKLKLKRRKWTEIPPQIWCFSVCEFASLFSSQIFFLVPTNYNPCHTESVGLAPEDGKEIKKIRGRKRISVLRFRNQDRKLSTTGATSELPLSFWQEEAEPVWLWDEKITGKAWAGQLTPPTPSPFPLSPSTSPPCTGGRGLEEGLRCTLPSAHQVGLGSGQANQTLRSWGPNESSPKVRVLGVGDTHVKEMKEGEGMVGEEVGRGEGGAVYDAII